MSKGNFVYGKLQFNDIKTNDLEKVLKQDEIIVLENILDNLVKEEILVKEGMNYRYTSYGLFYGNNVCAYVTKEFLNTINNTII